LMRTKGGPHCVIESVVSGPRRMPHYPSSCGSHCSSVASIRHQRELGWLPNMSCQSELCAIDHRPVVIEV
jgi:hypothetical protein